MFPWPFFGPSIIPVYAVAVPSRLWFSDSKVLWKTLESPAISERIFCISDSVRESLISGIKGLFISAVGCQNDPIHRVAASKLSISRTSGRDFDGIDCSVAYRVGA